tara:strand:- start:11622 stop:12053 length:432 start_codon:yes stop_codon:yes gene_type:complete
MNRALAELYGTVSRETLNKMASAAGEVETSDELDLSNISAAELLNLLSADDVDVDAEPVEEKTAEVETSAESVEDSDEGEEKVAFSDDEFMQYDTLGRIMAHQVYAELDDAGTETTDESEKVAEDAASQADRLRSVLIGKLSE